MHGFNHEIITIFNKAPPTPFDYIQRKKNPLYLFKIYFNIILFLQYNNFSALRFLFFNRNFVVNIASQSVLCV